MGGVGSGRQPGFGRGTVETGNAINVSQLHHGGHLAPGKWGQWGWWAPDGTVTGGVNFFVTNDDTLILGYQARLDTDSPFVEMEERIQIARVNCQYGETRPYLVCPGTVNGKNCAAQSTNLYLTGLYFKCRRCAKLAYASQREDKYHRLARQARKIRKQVGGELCALRDPFPPRPRGMWRKKYEALREEADWYEGMAERLWDEDHLLRLSKLTYRLGIR